MTSVLTLLALVGLFSTGVPAARFSAPWGGSQTPRTESASRPACRDWRECRQRALEAAQSGQFETFHDLAWKAVSLGPSGDPELLYLLAHAQSLSGRPHDALVMLRRLADRGVFTDAGDRDAFRQVRDLPGWSELETVVAGVESAAATNRLVSPLSSLPETTLGGSATTAVATSAGPPPTASSPRISSSRPERPATTGGRRGETGSGVVEALRFAGRRFVPGGLAYDRVSARFLVGDLRARKIVTIAESTGRPVDLVRSESAGFRDVRAIEIDSRRGDLWVVSASRSESTAAPSESPAAVLHKLQLVSGRPLGSIHLSSDQQPARFSDVAVSKSGTVFVLDELGRRIFRVRPRAQAFELVVTLNLAAPISLAMSTDDQLAYVAHAGGVSRVNLSNRTVAALGTEEGTELSGIERLRWYDGALVGVQSQHGNERRVIKIRLDGRQRAATRVEVLDAWESTDESPSVATLSGDDFYYLADGAEAASAPGSAADDSTETIVRRARLR